MSLLLCIQTQPVLDALKPGSCGKRLRWHLRGSRINLSRGKGQKKGVMCLLQPKKTTTAQSAWCKVGESFYFSC